MSGRNWDDREKEFSKLVDAQKRLIDLLALMVEIPIVMRSKIKSFSDKKADADELNAYSIKMFDLFEQIKKFNEI